MQQSTKQYCTTIQMHGSFEKRKRKWKVRIRPLDGLCLPCPTHNEVFLTLFKKHLTTLFEEKKSEKDCFYWSGKASPWVRSPDKRLECKRRSGTSLCHWWRHQPLRRWTHLVLFRFSLEIYITYKHISLAVKLLDQWGILIYSLQRKCIPFSLVENKIA